MIDRAERIVDRGIFRADSGVWWYWSPIHEGRASSLHTKDLDKATVKYSRLLTNLREAFERARNDND